MKVLKYVFVLPLLFGLLSASNFASAAPGRDGDKNSVKTIVVSQKTPESVSPAKPDIKPPGMKMGMCSQCCCMGSGGKCKPGKMMKPMLSCGPGMMKHKMIKGMRHMKGSCGGGHLLGLAGELELTDEQKAKIEGIHLKTKLALVDLKAALTKERIKLRKLIGDEGKISKIKAQMEAVLNAEMNLRLKKITARRDIQNILTDEQREKIKSLDPMHGMLQWDIEEPGDAEDIEIILDDQDPHMGMSKVIETEIDCCE